MMLMKNSDLNLQQIGYNLLCTKIKLKCKRRPLQVLFRCKHATRFGFNRRFGAVKMLYWYGLERSRDDVTEALLF